MGEFVVTVNGRPFTLLCGEGEEARLNRLAEFIDAKIAAFVADVGQVGDARLILMAALVIADELAEARARLAAGAATGQDAVLLEKASAGLESLAVRIEALAAELSRS